MKYYRSLFILFLLALTSGLRAQDEVVLEVFNTQIEAFNNHDVDALIANIDENFAYYGITEDSLIREAHGAEVFRADMEAYFVNVKGVHTEIINYIISGDKISFEERISWTSDDGRQNQAETMGVYQIENGKITRTWYFY